MTRILTPEQHDEYEHLCEKTGKYLDLHPGHCKLCEDYIICMMDHASYIPPGISIERFLDLYPLMVLQRYQEIKMGENLLH